MTTAPKELSPHPRPARRSSGRPDTEPVPRMPLQSESLESLVAYDPYTGAFARAHFHTLAASEWERALRAQRELSFILLRLRAALPDGHFDAPLDLLRTAVGAIRSVLRSGGDAIGRLDSLEFAVLLPETGSDGARDVVGRLIPALDTVLQDASEATYGPITADMCSVTLSKHSVGEKGWQGALSAARNLLHSERESPEGRVMHLDILASHRRTACADRFTRGPSTDLGLIRFPDLWSEPARRRTIAMTAPEAIASGDATWTTRLSSSVDSPTDARSRLRHRSAQGNISSTWCTSIKGAGHSRASRRSLL